MGDRPFTDIVYGNRNGFLTALTEPLSLPEEPFIVRQVGFTVMNFLFDAFQSIVKVALNPEWLKLFFLISF